MLISLRRRLSSSSLLYDPLRLITRIGFYTLCCIPKDKNNFQGDSTMTSMTALLRHFHEYYGFLLFPLIVRVRLHIPRTKRTSLHACYPVTGVCISPTLDTFLPRSLTKLHVFWGLLPWEEKKYTWQSMHRLVE